MISLGLRVDVAHQHRARRRRPDHRVDAALRLADAAFLEQRQPLARQLQLDAAFLERLAGVVELVLGQDAVGDPAGADAPPTSASSPSPCSSPSRL